MFQEFIGKVVFYTDYLGIQQQGKIIYIEPGPDPNDPSVVWVYLEDIFEVMDNDKMIILQDGSVLRYAEMRLSTEVIPFEEGDPETFNDMELM